MGTKFNDQCRNDMPPRRMSCIISHLPHVAEIISTYRKNKI